MSRVHDDQTIGVWVQMPTEVYQRIKRAADEAGIPHARDLMAQILCNACCGARDSGQDFADWCARSGYPDVAAGDCTQSRMHAAGRAYRRCLAALKRLMP